MFKKNMFQDLETFEKNFDFLFVAIDKKILILEHEKCVEHFQKAMETQQNRIK